MATNGSPPPIFKTDENHTYFLVTLPIHPEATRKIALKEQLKPSEEKTHQLEPKTHQFIDKDGLPKKLKIKINELHKKSNSEDIKSVICALCAWKPLTAQHIAELLNRNKKHLVRSYLTPLVKDSKLKYVYPERGNSPNQAYTT